jgi:hypothetical protein
MNKITTPIVSNNFMKCHMNVNNMKSLLMILMTGLQVEEENKELKNNNFFMIKHYSSMNS